MEVARYTVGCSIVFPKGEIARFDGQLKSLEAKMKASAERMKGLFNLRLNSFSVNQRGLDKVLGNALDIASNRTIFHIENFVVDQSRLNRALTAAMVRATAFTDAGITIKSPKREGSSVARSGTSKAAAVGGLIGGGLSRFYGPALALGLGGYGLGALNRRNQEVVAAQLQTQAVSTANGGTAEQGDQSFAWLKQQANRVGFNYLQASPDFNNLTANLLGSGSSVEDSKKVFKGFAEYGRINKLSGSRMQLVFKALSDIAGKDKLQAQELTLQLGNSLPGAKGIFAQAYQNQLKATGKGKGDLTGSASIVALLDAMKKGNVRGDILTYAADIASEKAAPGLTKASQASQAEQAKYQNTLTDMAVLASNSGVEEGFARIFRTLNAGLSESGGLVRTLSEGFNEATKWADDLLLFPQSFIRALEGKDSMVADWLGIGQTSQLVKDWQDIKMLWEQMAALNPTKLFGDFLPTLEATTKELAAILNAIAEFQRWKDTPQAKPEELRQQTPKTYDQIEKIAPFGLDLEYASPIGIFGAAWDNTFVNLNNARVRGRAVYDDPNSYFYQNPALYDENQKNMAMDQATAANDYQLNGSGSVTNQFDISIHIDPATMGAVDIQGQAEDLMNRFKIELSNASVIFPVKE